MVTGVKSRGKEEERFATESQRHRGTKGEAKETERELNAETQRARRKNYREKSRHGPPAARKHAAPLPGILREVGGGGDLGEVETNEGGGWNGGGVGCAGIG